MPQFTEADTLRILVATDNHVGYEERDPIRKDDSWQTFDEIMNLARMEDVDMVLLGGDLFHDNKPSRKSLYQVMRSLRKNCLGPKPCEVEFLSDANEVFEGAFPTVNYEDPDINVSIPVFSIHGNHDDPSGEGHFCSLDLLQVAGLVNYFGRIPEVDNIEAKPILLQKGATKLALFGLGNVRDERMFRTFRDHKVKWFRPGAQSGDWFNLLTVHQNHHAHTATSYLPENVLPDWMDLVVWGHEHECLIDPKQNPETGFHVMQPGSSVATSLVAGEAVQKHVAVVSLTGKEFKVDKIPLKTVRPFVTRELVLATDKRFKGLDTKKDNRQEVTRRLMEVVGEMIEEANADWASLQSDVDEPGEPPLPLIRLKVEYTAGEGGRFDCENPQRFSNRFVGKVANTNDVVYFYRKKSSTKRNNATDDVPKEALEALGADTIKVDRLVREFLAAQSLKILPQAPFGDAVNQFVTKDDKHAMETFVSESLAGQVKQMLDLDSDEEDLDSAMELYRARLDEQFSAGTLTRRRRVLREPPDGWDSDLDGHWAAQPGAYTEVADESLASGGRGEDMDVDEDEEEPVRKAPARRTTTTRAKPAPTTTTAKAPARRAPAKAPAKAAPAKRAPARGRRKQTPSDDEVVDEEEVPAPAPAPRATTRTTARRQPARATRQTRLDFSQAQAAAGRSQAQAAAGRSQADALEISDDEISDDFEPRRRR
ncbi:probable recombinational repair protein mus-23 [Cephalotrichum gorgonifer]|uniref:Double-strand break repair protein n=1 Tax=Cephalotrichum gorgonifer TaxID=2041049 RepID=A0AAE8N1E6_9PEZI|nr:probable recombinational repair protein mus-23 [Cephalotrichum gorgonifer]